MRLVAALRPDPLHGGAHSDPPDPLAGLRGETGAGVGKGKGRKDGHGRKGEDPNV